MVQLEEAGRSHRSSSTWQLVQMAAEAGPLGTARVEPASKIRPKVGGKPLQRVPEERPYEEAPEVLARDSDSPQDLPIPNEY